MDLKPSNNGGRVRIPKKYLQKERLVPVEGLSKRFKFSTLLPITPSIAVLFENKSYILYEVKGGFIRLLVIKRLK
jgi:hypothetical protein